MAMNGHPSIRKAPNTGDKIPFLNAGTAKNSFSSGERHDVTNKYLERYGHEERIDHRSFAERGIEEQPTIHEGVSARAMEAKGIISDRCELNRQIKADNKLLRELKAQVKKIAEAIRTLCPTLQMHWKRYGKI